MKRTLVIIGARDPHVAGSRGRVGRAVAEVPSPDLAEAANVALLRGLDGGR